jgi:hypothetical protein
MPMPGSAMDNLTYLPVARSEWWFSAKEMLTAEMVIFKEIQ